MASVGTRLEWVKVAYTKMGRGRKQARGDGIGHLTEGGQVEIVNHIMQGCL